MLRGRYDDGIARKASGHQRRPPDLPGIRKHPSRNPENHCTKR
jgi:hypothetical protein